MTDLRQGREIRIFGRTIQRELAHVSALLQAGDA